MGIQREPGQKGVNWSNIAVGERLFALSCRKSGNTLTQAFTQVVL